MMYELSPKIEHHEHHFPAANSIKMGTFFRFNLFVSRTLRAIRSTVPIPTTFFAQLKKFILNSYRGIIFFTAVALLIAIYVEHRHDFPVEDTHLLGELLLYVILVGTVIFYSRELVAAHQKQQKIIKNLQARQNLIHSLSESTSIVDITERLARQISFLAPIQDLQLYLYEQDKAWFIRSDTLLAEAAGQAGARLELLPGLDPYHCRHCLAKEHPELHRLNSCKQVKVWPNPLSRTSFCLPLIEQGKPVGILHLYVDPNKRLSSEQIELLESVSVEISTTLEKTVAQTEREAALVTQRIRLVQLEIARDLHDTVGQNISYLRMRLDRLSEMEPDQAPALTLELNRSRDVANEAYDLVRGTLSLLQAGETGDFRRVITRYAEQVGERSAFTVQVNNQGQEQQLSQHLMRQLFYIFREAICNIEKHARASLVQVQLDWQQDGLHMTISDNGLGFDQDQTPPDHFGLKFMRERASQVKGSLSILSTAGSGTTITLQVPYE